MKPKPKHIKPNKKTYIILGVAAGAILLMLYIKKREAEKEAPAPVTAPSTYLNSQEAAGNYGNYGGGGGGGGLTGGGAPESAPPPGVVTAPTLPEVKYLTPQQAAEKIAAREKWEKEHGLVPISQADKEAGLGGLYYTHPPKEPGLKPPGPPPYPYHLPAKEPKPNFQ